MDAIAYPENSAVQVMTMPAIRATIWIRTNTAIATSEKRHWPPAVLPENLLVSEVLRGMGLYTALLASYGGSGYFQTGWGMFQGFDDVDVSLQRLHSRAGDPANTSGTSSRELADLTIAWLSAHRDRRFFLWTHFYDPHFGFDAQEERYGDLMTWGIIDPAKVVRTALEDAASVAGLLITTEAMVAEKPEKKAAAGAGGGMGGMGGMGDMDF